jgi:recombination protein RecA
MPDASYAQKLGGRSRQPARLAADNGEQALEIVEVLIRSNGVDVAADSNAALVPKRKSKARWAKRKWGPQARLMSQALRS